MTFYPERWPNTNSDSSLVSPRQWERPDTYFTSNFSWTMARFERVQAFSDRTIADCANSQQSVAFPPLFYTCSWFASVLSVECLSLSLSLSLSPLCAHRVYSVMSELICQGCCYSSTGTECMPGVGSSAIQYYSCICLYILTMSLNPCISFLHHRTTKDTVHRSEWTSKSCKPSSPSIYSKPLCRFALLYLSLSPRSPLGIRV